MLLYIIHLPLNNDSTWYHRSSDDNMAENKESEVGETKYVSHSIDLYALIHHNNGIVTHQW